MIRRGLLALASLMALILAAPVIGGDVAPAASSDAPASLRAVESAHADIFRRFSPAVVGIGCAGPRGSGMQYFGTGVVISSDGLILTDTTVVPPGGTRIEVYFTDGLVRPGTIVEFAEKVEAIVIKVEAQDLPFMRLADSAEYAVGDPVYSWGNPYYTIQNDGAVCLGVGAISGLYKVSSVDAQSRYIGPVIETDAAVNPGSDGGPLTDSDGNLIGILSLAYSRTRWLGLAIPTHELILALPSLKAQHTAKRPALSGDKAVVWAQQAAFMASSKKVDPSVVTVVWAPGKAELAAKRSEQALEPLAPVATEFLQSAEASRPSPGMASGFIVDADGTIVTAAFNLNGRTDNIRVYLADGTLVEATVLGTDDWHDMAVLKIDARPGLVPVTLGDATGLTAGRSLAVLGRSEAPGGLTMNTGTVSATRRFDRTCCQISALINYGNMGGPVIDLHGQMVGMTTHLGEKTAWRQNCGVGFMLQAEVIARILPELKSGRKATRPERPFFGIRSDTASLDVQGARILEVVANGPSEAAGIKVNDVVIAFAGQPIANWMGLHQAIRRCSVGDTVNVTVLRDQVSVEVVVTVGKRD